MILFDIFVNIILFEWPNIAITRMGESVRKLQLLIIKK